MAFYTNDARNKRTGGNLPESSKGKQGAHGEGNVKVSGEGDSSKEPKFLPAAQVLGEPVYGEHDVPGTNVVKGASTVGYDAPKKGEANPKSGGGKIQKPKDAEFRGY